MRFIQTQNKELLNLSNIIEIALAEGEGTDKNGEQLKLYAVVAVDITGKERELGIYSDGVFAEKQMIDIGAFLGFNATVYYMPEEG